MFVNVSWVRKAHFIIISHEIDHWQKLKKLKHMILTDKFSTTFAFPMDIPYECLLSTVHIDLCWLCEHKDSMLPEEIESLTLTKMGDNKNREFVIGLFSAYFQLLQFLFSIMLQSC